MAYLSIIEGMLFEDSVLGSLRGDIGFLVLSDSYYNFCRPFCLVLYFILLPIEAVEVRKHYYLPIEGSAFSNCDELGSFSYTRSRS